MQDAPFYGNLCLRLTNSYKMVKSKMHMYSYLQAVWKQHKFCRTTWTKNISSSIFGIVLRLAPFFHLVSTGFLDCRCPGAVKAAFLIIYYFNGTDNSKNPVEVRWKKVCGSKRDAAFSSSPPTEFIMYDHSKKPEPRMRELFIRGL